ncbi:MAG: protein translocase subunit SecD [Firmicutes bacterium]|nr:protein translocase subunit SecD [Bacillota bacterium]
MRRGDSIRLLLLVVIVAVAGVVLYRVPMNLGLDLRGGVHVVMQAQESPGVKITEETMQRVVSVVERRVNGMGVSEPIIQRQGGRRVIIQLPGIYDQQAAIATIGKTAQLEIKNPLGETVLTGADLIDAQLSRDQFGRPSVAVEFNKEGTKKFAQLTTVYQGQAIPHVLDGEILVNPVVQGPITGGKGQITGQFTIDEAKNLAVLLKAGSLPVPMEVMEIRNVGPTLGQQSISRSLRAGIIGIILVFLYMLAYYRLPGLVADIALAIYVVIVLAAMAGLRATLTLPGIAGFILSIGMAVDANVLIFERIREEFKAGKHVRAAVAAGFDRAFRAIFDANITTLLTAVVLFYYGSGPVKGFAVTLSLGILASMFTAIVVTRLMLNMIVDANPSAFERHLGVKGVLQ